MGYETATQRGRGVKQGLTGEQVEGSEEQCDYYIPEEPGDESLLSQSRTFVPIVLEGTILSSNPIVTHAFRSIK